MLPEQTLARKEVTALDINPMFLKSTEPSAPEQEARNIYCERYRLCLSEAARQNCGLQCSECGLRDSQNDWDVRY